MKNFRLHKEKIIALVIGNMAGIGMLSGCAAMNQSELLQAINRGDQIEIEVAVPLNEEQGTEQSILWEQLASLTTNSTLRSTWDDTLLITKTDTGKNGILYVNASGENDNNNTLRVALHNRAFLQYLESEDTIETLADAAMSQYVDIEPEETIKAVYMGINGYFNLLPDADINYSNPDSTLTRAEFMSMVMRAETPVSEITADSAFAAAVGNNDLNIYAQEVTKDNYLDLASKSLNNMTINGTMTRAEAIYLLMNHYFKEELANVNISNATLSDVKDGGDIATAQKFIEKGTEKDYWKSYELTYAISNPDGGVPTSLYKALVLAEQKGIITSETRWDEGITKAEAIEFLVSTLEADTSIEMFNYKQGTISGYEVTETENPTEVEQNSSVNSTSDDIILGDDEYKGDDPRDTGTTVKEEPAATTEHKGVDIDGDGKISQSEADLYKKIYGIIEEAANGGSTTTPSGGSSVPGPTGQQGGMETRPEAELPQIVPGSGDYTGGGGTVY